MGTNELDIWKRFDFLRNFVSSVNDERYRDDFSSNDTATFASGVKFLSRSIYRFPRYFVDKLEKYRFAEYCFKVSKYTVGAYKEFSLKSDNIVNFSYFTATISRQCFLDLNR